MSDIAMFAIGQALLDDSTLITHQPPSPASRTLDMVQQEGFVPDVEIADGQYAADLVNFVVPAVALLQSLVVDLAEATARDQLEVIHDLRAHFSGNHP